MAAPLSDLAAGVRLIALPGLPLIGPGDDLAGHIMDGLARAHLKLASGDVLVVAQKIVSKAEDRYVDLAAVTPSPKARALAEKTDKDPRLVEVIVSESSRVLRHRPGVLIVVHRLGMVLANAGIDSSNVGPVDGGERVLLLPEDPDRTCTRLRAELRRRAGADVGVVVNDSVGRAWRQGTVGMALGAAGLASLQDLRGRRDLYGRPLEVTKVGRADELAAAASLVQGQADEGRPVVLVRGLEAADEPGDAATLMRPESEDLFR